MWPLIAGLIVLQNCFKKQEIHKEKQRQRQTKLKVSDLISSFLESLLIYSNIIVMPAVLMGSVLGAVLQDFKKA